MLLYFCWWTQTWHNAWIQRCQWTPHFLSVHTSLDCTHTLGHTKGQSLTLCVCLCVCFRVSKHSSSVKIAHVSRLTPPTAPQLWSPPCEAGAQWSGCLRADSALLTRLTSHLSVSEDTLCSETVGLWWHMSYKLVRRNLKERGGCFQALCDFVFWWKAVSCWDVFLPAAMHVDCCVSSSLDDCWTFVFFPQLRYNWLKHL